MSESRSESEGMSELPDPMATAGTSQPVSWRSRSFVAQSLERGLVAIHRPKSVLDRRSWRQAPARIHAAPARSRLVKISLAQIIDGRIVGTNRSLSTFLGCARYVALEFAPYDKVGPNKIGRFAAFRIVSRHRRNQVRNMPSQSHPMIASLHPPSGPHPLPAASFAFCSLLRAMVANQGESSGKASKQEPLTRLQQTHRRWKRHGTSAFNVGERLLLLGRQLA